MSLAVTARLAMSKLYQEKDKERSPEDPKIDRLCVTMSNKKYTHFQNKLWYPYLGGYPNYHFFCKRVLPSILSAPHYCQWRMRQMELLYKLIVIPNISHELPYPKGKKCGHLWWPYFARVSKLPFILQKSVAKHPSSSPSLLVENAIDRTSLQAQAHIHLRPLHCI